MTGRGYRYDEQRRSDVIGKVASSPRSAGRPTCACWKRCASRALGKKGACQRADGDARQDAARSAQGFRPGRQRRSRIASREALEAKKSELERRALCGPACHRESRHQRCRYGWGRCRTGASIRSARCGTRWPRSSATWASRSPRARISRPTTSTSPSSTSRRSIRRGRTTTRSTCARGRAATRRRWCCARTPAPCRSAP